MSDGRLRTLAGADPAEIDSVQKRYQHISDTIDDAVTKLQKIVDAGGDGLVGQYVEPLKKDASSIKDDLSKAATRYRDVATEITKYQPELEHAITEVRAATGDEADADTAVTRAHAMPDPQKGPDGTISPEEQRKAVDKQNATEQAQSQVTAAKNRLTGALDALDVAGKRFGDAVNCNRYDDGLTDSTKDKILNAFKWISKIFGIIAMVLTALAILIPGVNLLVIAGVVAGAVLLISDSVLFANGEGSLANVLLDVFGLGLAGFAAGFAKLAKMTGSFAKFLNAFKFKPGTWGPGGPIPLPNWGETIAGIAPEAGFFRSNWTAFVAGLQNWKNLFTGNFTAFWRGWMTGLFDMKTFGDLIALGGGISKQGWWFFWGGLNLSFNLGASLIFAGFGTKES